MKLPFELKQKDVSLTPAATEGIQDRAERLEKFCNRITRCTVTVEGSGRHHRQGSYGVRIDLTVPGTELVVHKKAEANLELALKAAFDTMTRRLEDHVQRERGFVKKH